MTLQKKRNEKNRNASFECKRLVFRKSRIRLPTLLPNHLNECKNLYLYLAYKRPDSYKADTMNKIVPCIFDRLRVFKSRLEMKMAEIKEFKFICSPY